MDVSEATRKAVSDAILALVTGTKVKLFQNDITPDGLTPLADFVVCDFDGYAAIAVTTGTQYRDNGTGEWVVLISAGATFVAGSGITAPQTAFGFYVTNTAGSVLVASDRLDAPFTFTLEDDGLVLPAIQIRVPIGSFSS